MAGVEIFTGGNFLCFDPVEIKRSRGHMVEKIFGNPPGFLDFKF